MVSPPSSSVPAVPVVPSAATPRRGRGWRVVWRLYVVAAVALLFSPVPFSETAILLVFVFAMLFLPFSIWYTGGQARALRAEPERDLLYRYGRPARATVVNLEYLHEQFGFEPVCRCRVSLEPLDGSPAVLGERKMIVSSALSGSITQRLPAYYDPADPNRFTLVVSVDSATPASVQEHFQQAKADRQPSPDDENTQRNRLAQVQLVTLEATLRSRRRMRS